MASSAGTPIELSAFDSGDPQDKMASSADSSTEMVSDVNPPMETVAFDLGDKMDIESILDKLDISQLPQELQSIDKQDLKQKFSNAKKSISILLTGKTGSGKSTLINGILGLNVEGKKCAREGDDLKACTTKVEAYQEKIGGIDVMIWDSPGLQDGTENEGEYIKQMKEKCSNRDLTIYCIRISDTRLVSGSDEVKAMKKLTEAFGHDFWKTTIIVLTFANIYRLINMDWYHLTKEQQDVVYKKKIQQWRERIREILTNDINVPNEIIKAIPTVPAGYYKDAHLPCYKFWFSKLFLHCMSTIPTPEGQAALVKMCADRFKHEEDATVEDFTKPIEQQPIIADTDIKRRARAAGLRGAKKGAAVGAIGLIAGPLGLITIPVGAVVWGGIAYTTQVIIYLLAQRKEWHSTK